MEPETEEQKLEASSWTSSDTMIAISRKVLGTFSRSFVELEEVEAVLVDRIFILLTPKKQDYRSFLIVVLLRSYEMAMEI
jgi:hypothetical protein